MKSVLPVLANQTVERFAISERRPSNATSSIFFPMKLDSDWRENTAKESMREIRKHVISDLGDVPFQEITAALLRALLKKKAEQGLGKETVNHIRFYLTEICRSATAEGYLANNVSEGLKAPNKS